MTWGIRHDRVLYVMNALITMGGVEHTTLEEICFLRGRGLTVEVCALRQLGEAARVFRDRGVIVHDLPVYTVGANRSTISLPGLLRFAWFVARGRYGIVVGTQAPSHYLARLACFPRLGRRLIVIERTQVRERSAKLRRLDRLCSRWTDRIVCVSREVRDALIEVSGVSAGRLVVIEHGYRLPEPAAPDSELAARLAGCFVFGGVSRLVPLKRVDVLLKAFAEVHRRHPRTRLLLVGGGPLETELHRLADSLGIAEAVLFIGEVANAFLYYPLMDAFVFPSVSEGLGGVYVEAWLHGLPVICAGVRPMSDYVRHGDNGLLFEADQPASLAAAMESLLTDADLRRKLGTNGSRTAREVFDFDTQLRKLYEVVVGHATLSVRPSAIPPESRP